MENRRSDGYMVAHEDGRRGIAYSKDQRQRFQKEDKIVVQFMTEDMEKDGAKRAVKAEKLTIRGFVD